MLISMMNHVVSLVEVLYSRTKRALYDDDTPPCASVTCTSAQGKGSAADAPC
jgi:hypothetical protein